MTPPVVLTKGDHVFQIQSKGAGGRLGAWSPVMSFSVDPPPPPGVPTLVSPSGLIHTTTPTYVWREVATATDYYLWVNSGPNPVYYKW